MNKGEEIVQQQEAQEAQEPLQRPMLFPVYRAATIILAART